LPTASAVANEPGRDAAAASRRLADWGAGLAPDDIPETGRRLLKLLLLDTIGCALGALGTPPAETMRRYASRAAAGGPCTSISLGRAGPEVAAMVNATLAHILIFDDLHRHGKLHPGVAVVPAALATAELVGAGGKDLLAALAAGYETTARIGVAIGLASHRHRGWRATGTCGSFGAAIASARLLGLDGGRTHDALAAAAAQTSGSWAFHENGGGELYLAAGTAARNGMTAALLAEAGFAGAADPLGSTDGGFFMLTSDAADPSEVDDRLGARWRLADTCIKMHPTCHSALTAIDAAVALRRRHGIGPGDIDRIVVRAGEITRQQCGWAYAPAPPAKLIFHIGYAMAVAFRNGRVLPADFEGEAPRDPALVRVASRTEVVEDPELTAIYALRKPADVTVFLTDGRMLHERVDFCRGEPENPPGEDDVLAKFRMLAEGHLPASALDEIGERVLELEVQTDIRRLAGLLAGAR
jgi:2-methylcitrate dehydratase PrpD